MSENDLNFFIMMIVIVVTNKFFTKYLTIKWLYIYVSGPFSHLFIADLCNVFHSIG